jgi:hypothetical protein
MKRFLTRFRNCEQRNLFCCHSIQRFVQYQLSPHHHPIIALIGPTIPMSSCRYRRSSVTLLTPVLLRYRLELLLFSPINALPLSNLPIYTQAGLFYSQCFLVWVSNPYHALAQPSPTMLKGNTNQKRPSLSLSVGKAAKPIGSTNIV